MKLTIDAEGAHEPDWHYMVVDDQGVLVDLDGLGGPLADQTVIRLDWDDQIPILFPERRDERTGQLIPAMPAGKIYRRPPGTAAITATGFNDRGGLEPYLEAYRARLAAVASAQGG